jgi:hypothetical protein
MAKENHEGRAWVGGMDIFVNFISYAKELFI